MKSRSTFIILQEIERIDLEDNKALLSFLDKSYKKINVDYKTGDREHFRKIITDEQDDGAILSENKIKKLNKILDKLEFITDNEHEKGLLSIFRMTAEGMLEPEYIYKVLQREIGLVQIEAEIRDIVKPANDRIIKEATDLLLALNGSTDSQITPQSEEKEKLIQLCYDAQTLNLLLFHMLNIKKYYEEETHHAPQGSRNIIEINRFIQEQLKLFQGDKITIHLLIHKLWKFINSKHDKIKGDGWISLLKRTPTIGRIIHEKILKNPRIKSAIDKLPQIVSIDREVESKKQQPS